MNVLVWLDATLVALGLLAMSPRLWNRFRHRRTVCPPVVGRGMQTATALLFYLGLGGLTMAGVDVGLAMKDAARRSRGSVNDESHYYSAHTRRFPQNAEAPDFRLPLVDEDCSIRLSEFRGHKPVVLIFGSFG